MAVLRVEAALEHDRARSAKPSCIAAYPHVWKIGALTRMRSCARSGIRSMIEIERAEAAGRPARRALGGAGRPRGEDDRPAAPRGWGERPRAGAASSSASQSLSRMTVTSVGQVADDGVELVVVDEARRPPAAPRRARAGRRTSPVFMSTRSMPTAAAPVHDLDGADVVAGEQAEPLAGLGNPCRAAARTTCSERASSSA